MNSRNITASIVRRIAIIAATLVAIGFLSGCAYPISCACGPGLPEPPSPFASEIKIPMGADSKQYQIACVNVDEGRPR